MPDTSEADITAVEDKRAARKAALASARNTQRALDLVAIDELEVEHGDSNVAIIELPFVEGLPTCAAVRTPKRPEVKRYQDRIKRDKSATAEAAEEIGKVAVIYPSDPDVVAKLYDSRPGLPVQLGVAALNLATGKDADEGKS
jgi:hypothetical protein